MGLIATDRVWAPVFCFGVQGFHPNDFLAFSFHYNHFFVSRKKNCFISVIIFQTLWPRLQPYLLPEDATKVTIFNHTKTY